MGDFASPVAFDLAKTLRKAAARDRGRARRGRDPPRGGARSQSRRRGLSQFLSGPRAPRPRSACRSRDARAPPGQSDRRAHQHQSQQGRPHRPPAQRRSRRRPRPGCLRRLGHAVEVQNYLDDTGVQVADVVAGLLHLEKRGRRSRTCAGPSARAAFPGERRTPRDSRTSAGTCTPKSGGPTPRGPKRRPGRPRCCTRSRPAATRRLRSRRPWPRPSPPLTSPPWAASASRTTCFRARATSCTSTSGPRAFERLKGVGGVPSRDEGKHAGCWVLRLSESPEFAGMEEPDKILVRSNGTVTYTGKDIAYQLWKFGLLDADFDYTRFRPDWNSGSVREQDVPEAVRAHPLWRTAHKDGEPDAPSFGGAEPRLQRDRRAPGLPAERRPRGPSGPRLHGRGRRARSTSPTRSSRSRRRPPASSPSVSARSIGSRRRTKRSRTSRCPAGRASA